MNISNKALAKDIAQKCGEVTVGCTDAAGIVSNLLESSENTQTKQRNLNVQSDLLFKELSEVVKTTDNASNLAQDAKHKLESGNATIETALTSFDDVTKLIDRLSHQIESLTGAMNEVTQVTSSIDQIAKTTNMLALNATIEAEKAGAVGATFAVVASEVKKLSNDTRLAADKITQTVSNLSDETVSFISDLKSGVKHNKEAQLQLNDLKSVVTDVASIIIHVEAQNATIAKTTGALYETENRNSIVRKEVVADSENIHNNLSEVHERIGSLEEKSNEMFDIFVKSGLSPQDSSYVEKSIDCRNKIRDLTEDAIANGGITIADIFDLDYKKVQGTNPQLYRTRLSDWSDANWRPIYDQEIDSDTAIVSLVCSSQTGFLPTHKSVFSRMPTGEIKHDTQYCRNGRIIDHPPEYHIKRSDAEYTMSVYRQEGNGDTYMIVRNIYVPLFIQGRRWGDVELAYII